MLWLTTLFLLIVGSYLLLQALSERKLVNQRIEESGVEDTDPGLFMTVNERINPTKLEGNVSIAEEDSKLARMVNRVQEKSANMSNRIERKIENATSGNTSESIFDKTLNKVKTTTEDAEKKFTSKLTTNQAATAASLAEEDSMMGRMVSKVNEGLSKAEDKYQARAQQAAAPSSGRLADETGLLASMAGKVSTRLDSLDQYVAKKLPAAQSNQGNDDGNAFSSNDNFFSRVVNKVGDQVNKVDDRIVNKVADKVNKIDDRFVEASRKLNRD